MKSHERGPCDNPAKMKRIHIKNACTCATIHAYASNTTSLPFCGGGGGGGGGGGRSGGEGGHHELDSAHHCDQMKARAVIAQRNPFPQETADGCGLLVERWSMCAQRGILSLGTSYLGQRHARRLSGAPSSPLSMLSIQRQPL